MAGDRIAGGATRRAPDETTQRRAPVTVRFARGTASQTSHVPFVFQIEPHYFQPKELTEKPQVLQDVFPTAKLSLPGVSIQSVVVRLLINEPGEADRVEIDESGLTDEAEGVVAQAFSKLKFYPGKLDDSFVKSQLKIEVTLENTPPVPPAALDK
jgi:hypothetical protein